MSRSLVIPLLTFCSITGCAPLFVRNPSVAPLRDVQVIGSYILPEQAPGDATGVVAEVSGAWYDPVSRELLTVVDRQERPELITMEVTVAPAVRLVPRVFTPVERAVAQRTLDLEGIAPAPGGNLFLASEGEEIAPEQSAPGVYEYTRQGAFVRRLRLPGAYAGMQSNAGIEGLSTSPDGTRLFAAPEGALRQDGMLATFDAGALTRILVLDMGGNSTPREYAYRTEPVPRFTSALPATGDNGISELLAIGQDDLLVLERAYVRETGSGARSANTIRLYHVHLDPAAEITGRWSLKDEPPAAVLVKNLVIDFGSLASQLEPRLKNLENFEAMSFGPALPDGRRTLLLISDNNFSRRQVTALVVLAFSGGASGKDRGGAASGQVSQ